MVKGTLLNFDQRYEDDLWVIFDQWPKLHLGLDALSNQKILKGKVVHYVQKFLSLLWPIPTYLPPAQVSLGLSAKVFKFLNNKRPRVWVVGGISR